MVRRVADARNSPKTTWLRSFKARSHPVSGKMLIAPFSLSAAHYPDNFQITPKFREIVSPFHRHGNCIPFAAIRGPDFGDQPSVGRPFAQILRHSDTPLLSFSPSRRFPRPSSKRGVNLRAASLSIAIAIVHCPPFCIPSRYASETKRRRSPSPSRKMTMSAC